MEENLIQLTASWERYSGQELSVVAANHIFQIDVGAYAATIDYGSVLSAKELEKSARFFRQEDRENYIVRKYALRQLLGKFLQQHPADIQFHQQANKKPAVRNLEFNTSHTKNGIAIAISQVPIGIDIEYIDPDFNYTDILHQCFSAAELKFIDTGADPRLNFYILWTRKEALLKATGQGLIDDLKQIDTLNSFNGRVFTLHSYRVNNIILSTSWIPKNNPLVKLWDYTL